MNLEHHPDALLAIVLLGVLLLALIAALRAGRRVRRRQRSGEQLLQSVLDHTDNAVMAIDADYRVLFVNRRYLELWQLEEAFFATRPTIGDVIREICRRGLYPLEQAEELVARRMEMLGWVLDYTDLETPRLDGVIVEGFAARMPGGGFLLTFRDVTRQRRAEEDLQRSREYFRTLVETVPHGILECDLHGTVTFANQSYARMQEQIREGELVGRSIFELIGDEESRSTARAAFARNLGAGRSHGTELVRNRDLAGRTLWRQVDWALRRNADGASEGFLAVVTDITLQRQAEEQLRTANLVMRQLFHAAPMAIITLDQSGEILLWNQAATRIFGYDEEGVAGQRFPLIGLAASAREPFSGLLLRVCAGATVRGEYEAVRRDGRVFEVAVIAGPLHGGREPATEIILLVDDISERRRVEQALRNSEETYRNLVQATPVAIFVHVEGALVFLNPAAVALFGANNEAQLEGRQVADFLDPISRKDFLAALAEAQQDEKRTNSLQLQITPLSGGVRDVEATFLGVEYSGCEARMAICLDVTERNRSEAALRDSERKYRAIFDQAFQFSGLLDPHGRLIEANRSALEFVGVDYAEVRGQLFWETPWWSELPEYQQQVRAAIERGVYGESARFEVVNRGKNGREYWVDFSLRPVRDDWGAVVYLIVEGRDITARKRSEELTLLVARGVAAETGENFFRSLTRNLSQALGADYAFIGEISGDDVHVVAGVAHGKELAQFSYALAHTPCADVTRGGTVCTFSEAVASRFPDDHLLAEMQVEGYVGSPLLDSNGNPLGILVVLFVRPIRNVLQVESLLRIFASRAAAELERRRAERVLEASEARFRQLSHEFETIFNGIPDSLTVWAPQGQMVWANRASREFYRLSADALLGQRCEEVCRFEACYGDQCEIRRCFTSGRVEDVVRVTPDGRSWGIKTFPLRDEYGELVRVIHLASDISERVRLREEAARTSHLAALGELAAGVAHEINNPTGLILLDLPIIRDAFRDALPLLEAHHRAAGEFTIAGLDYTLLREQLPQLLDEVLDGAQRIKQIVEELKDFSRPFDARQFTPVDLCEVARKAVQLVGNQLKNATDRFELLCQADVPPTDGNVQRLEQVLINLILNACQALPDRRCGITVAVRYQRELQCNQIEVRDEGRGIKPEHLAQITDPFFTTRREVGGTGLGLSVSTRIIEEHGGTLGFASEPGRGTVVTVTLPARAGEVRHG